MEVHKAEFLKCSKNSFPWDFPGDSVVKNLSSNAREMGSIPGLGTKIPHAVGQLSWFTTTGDPECHNWDPVQSNK